MASALGLIVSLLLTNAPPAAAELPDPPSGGSYTWHSKQFADAPYKACIAKVGWAKQSGHLYFKSVVDCRQSPAFAYQLGSLLTVLRDNNAVFDEHSDYCGNAATTPIEFCATLAAKRDPAGRQKYQVLMKGLINNGTHVYVPWFTFYA